jgi:hypothetical protein
VAFFCLPNSLRASFVAMRKIQALKEFSSLYCPKFLKMRTKDSCAAS